MSSKLSRSIAVRPQRGGRVVHRERERVAGAGRRDRPAAVVPCTWPIRAPGMNVPIE